MVIKLFAASIARTAVLGSLHHVGLTDITVKVHHLARVIPSGPKNFLTIGALTLPNHKDVSWRGPCANICEPHRQDCRQGEDKQES